MVNKTIDSHKNMKAKIKVAVATISTFAAIMIFTISLNVNEAFAENMFRLPVVSEIAKLLTFREYSYETEGLKASVKIPNITDLSDDEFKKHINDIINEKVEIALEEANESAAEYKEAFLSTGGTEEEYESRKIEATVNYEIKSQNETILSFLVYSYDSIAAVSAEYSYYNLDLVNNEVITLNDYLGDDYIKIITGSIKESVKKQKENPDNSFFEDTINSDWTVREDANFYINSANNIVIVLDKYEIAPGYMGRLEYEITTE